MESAKRKPSSHLSDPLCGKKKKKKKFERTPSQDAFRTKLCLIGPRGSRSRHKQFGILQLKRGPSVQTETVKSEEEETHQISFVFGRNKQKTVKLLSILHIKGQSTQFYS